MAIFNFYQIYYSQSENASFKTGLCIDNFFESYENHIDNITSEWNRLDESLYTSLEIFGFHHFSFYFRAFKRLIDRMIEGGIMNVLVEKHYLKRRNTKKAKNDPKVLKLDDLGFGFEIWLGFCFISTAAFVAEIISKMKKRKFVKTKYAKVYPKTTNGCDSIAGPKNITEVSFKIKSKKEMN